MIPRAENSDAAAEAHDMLHYCCVHDRGWPEPYIYIYIYIYAAYDHIFDEFLAKILYIHRICVCCVYVCVCVWVCGCGSGQPYA